MESREFTSHNGGRARHIENAELILHSASQVRPNEKDFTDVHPQSIIDRDLDVVRILEQRFSENIDHLSPAEVKKIEEKKRRSEALEVVLVEGGELYNWFGDGAFLSRTSKYDDYNGIDGVLEIVREGGEDGEQEPHIVALAIDASMRPDLASVERKIKRNIERVMGPKKPAVKYFQSAVNGSRKSLTMVLPVVVGVQGEHAEELIDLFGEVIHLRAEKDKSDHIKKQLKEKLEMIADHPAQMVFLQEMLEQLGMYTELFSKRKDHDSSAYGKKAKELSEVISGIIEAKTDINPGKYINDGVFMAIESVSKEVVK